METIANENATATPEPDTTVSDMTIHPVILGDIEDKTRDIDAALTQVRYALSFAIDDAGEHDLDPSLIGEVMIALARCERRAEEIRWDVADVRKRNAATA